MNVKVTAYAALVSSVSVGLRSSTVEDAIVQLNFSKKVYKEKGVRKLIENWIIKQILVIGKPVVCVKLGDLWLKNSYQFKAKNLNGEKLLGNFLKE